MDNRDRYLQKHHQRRLQIAQLMPVERCIAHARKQKAIAMQQGRTAFTVLLAIWESELKSQLN